MAKNKAPDHIKEFYKKQKQLNKLLATTEVEHSKAYDVAVDAIRDEDGKVDYDLLKDSEKREEFIDKLTSHYITKAKEALKSDIKGGEFEENMLLQGYMGVTKEELKRDINSLKSKYTKEQHNAIAKELRDQQAKRLVPILSDHLTDEHIDSVVDYTKSEDIVDIKKLRKEHLGDLLSRYNEGKGAITEDSVEGKTYERKHRKAA